jgi:hypothetical protein
MKKFNLNKGAGMKIFKTRTFWLNICGGALICVNDLAGKIIPTEAATTILVVLNIINRFLTTKPVSER